MSHPSTPTTKDDFLDFDIIVILIVELWAVDDRDPSAQAALHSQGG